MRDPHWKNSSQCELKNHLLNKSPQSPQVERGLHIRSGWKHDGSQIQKILPQKNTEKAPFFSPPPSLPSVPPAGHCICLISGASFESFTGISQGFLKLPLLTATVVRRRRWCLLLCHHLSHLNISSSLLFFLQQLKGCRGEGGEGPTGIARPLELLLLQQ